VTEQDRNGRDSRKQAVSIRMSRSDVRNIKRLAERLGTRDSDVIRFAIKLMLGRLAPLQDPAVTGRNLVPVFAESGPDLMRHFDLDTAKLSSIINDGVERDRQVDADDIQLIALSGIRRSYLKLRIPSLRRANGLEKSGAEPDQVGARVPLGTAAALDAAGADADAIDQSLRQYLFDKYLYKNGAAQSGHTGGGR
jgi:Arc/MetJ-type ribon-helix-helix transcriptional regulator